MGDGLIERLNINLPDGPEAASRIAELEAENARLRGDGRIGSHSPDCWSLGPRHYDCATRRVAELEAKLATAVGALKRANIGTRGPDPMATRVQAEYDASRTVLRNALAARAQPPAGEVVVPVEPTEAMLSAGANAPYPCDAVDVWKAMLSAAPKGMEG